MQLRFVGCGNSFGSHLGKINARKLILTHMSDDMLGWRDKLPYCAAMDGMIFEL